ncbi:MAG: DUF4249 family protein [Gemmatimonadota bacterium]
MFRGPGKPPAARWGAISLGLLGLLGCSSPSEVEDHPQSLYVQAFLSPGVDPSVQLLETVRPEEFYDGLERFVSGAEVVIRSGDRTIALAEDPREPGAYGAPHGVLPIVAGQTYYLEASQGGRQLRAHTTVPLPAPVTRVVGDTITYYQIFGNLFGDLVHPGEFFWSRSPTAAGYVIVVEALGVRSLPTSAEPLTADLDSLLARRDRAQLAGVSTDSLAILDRQVAALRRYFEDNITLVSPSGDTVRWLRDREQVDWDEIETKDWSEGKMWRERRNDLYWSRAMDYWVPADSTHSDFWWAGVRFEATYRVTLHAADTNYFDYATTAFNGNSGADSDRGPVFHVDGGLGVFGSYSSDSFEVEAIRAD